MCSAAHLLRAGTYVVPGGNAYTYTQVLGPEVKAKLRAFVEGGGLYIGTCAGWFYASTGYYWEYDTSWPDAGFWSYPSLLGIFMANVEGSITDIADEETKPHVFDGHALTELSNGHHAIYYGGPTLGWHRTSESALPAGSVVLARYSNVIAHPPAIVRVASNIGGRTENEATRIPRMLLFSCHLEAYEGVGVTELTTVQREANYALRQKFILRELSRV